MDLLSPVDRHFMQAVACVTTLRLLQHCARYFLHSSVKPILPLELVQNEKVKATASISTRNISQALAQSNKQCVIFYGSQTGTAERLACQFAREALALFGLECLVADLSDYDFDTLLSLHGRVAVFLLATYGEGEATDNAIAFKRYLAGLTTSRSDSGSQLRYAAFGLGNSSYQYYNEMVKCLDKALSSRQCQRIGELGFGDDGQGTLEMQYTTWKHQVLPAIAQAFDLKERLFVYQPLFSVKEISEHADSNTFCGELNRRSLRNIVRGPYTLKNPYPAPISAAYQLCPDGERQFIHLEVDISNSTLSYEAGDHVTVQPTNSDEEVERFLQVFGWDSTRHHQIQITSTDASVKVPVPSPTTLDTIVRYYLDICGPLSPQLLLSLAHFVTDESFEREIRSIASSPRAFQEIITNRRLNLADLVEVFNAHGALRQVPISALLESIPLLKPRYYSISSSPLVSSGIMSITTVIEAQSLPSKDFKGVATNYLLDLVSPLLPASNQAATHQRGGPRQRYDCPTAFVTVRNSAFKLPRDCSLPVIMIGPGTGIAPFRGFVQNRVHQFNKGRRIGRTLLFYGCRCANEDFLYQKEWQELEATKTEFGADVFRLYSAFSREPHRPKQYVQDLMRQPPIASELRELILFGDARVYVCGDARRMATDVWTAMASILAVDESFREDTDAAVRFLQTMKRQGRWMEDTW